MPIIRGKEIESYYEVTGSRAAPGLVLSHSLGADSTMWNPQIAEFQKHFRVVQYDTRGHGRSLTTSGTYSVEQLGLDVIALLDTLEIEKTHFCGLSMGGPIGMWLGANRPARLHKLVLCNTAAKLGTPDGWDARIKAVRSGGLKSVAPSIIERWFTTSFRENNKAIVDETQQTIEKTDVQGYLACCAMLRDTDQRATISKIQLPTLIVGGAHDPVTTPADSHSIERELSGSKYVELEAAHLSNIEAAAEFNTEVGQFLDS